MLNSINTMKYALILIVVLINYVFCPKVDPLRESITNEEQRVFIKFHYLLGDRAPQISNMLNKIVRSRALSERQVYRIWQQFDTGEKTSCEENPKPGRPPTVNTPENQEKLKKLLYEDNNWGTEGYAQALGVSRFSIRCMLEELGAKKVAARWVPHELNPAQKEARVEICQENFDKYKADKTILDRIIAIDETWVKSYDPRDSQSSKRWQLPEQDP